MSHSPRNAKAVANEFLALAREDGQSLTQMKLQKLVFYAHGWHLGLTSRPLLDEEIEAWPYGPVVPSLYTAFKKYGSKKIESFAKDLDEGGDVFIPRLRAGYDVNLINRVWEEYGRFTAAQLSNLTHMPGTPWAETQAKNVFNLKTLGIDNDLIKRYFASAAAKNRGSVGAQ